LNAACPVCGGTQALALDRRAAVPVAQNLVFASADAARACPTGALDMRRCTGCGFVWNSGFDSAVTAYDGSYDNDQGFSPRFRAHTGKVAARIAARLADAPVVRLVEIGCGQGAFMATLAAALGDRWHGGCGYDPAWKGDGDSLPPRTEVRAEYFGPGSLQPDDARADAVVSRHVIEHVPDPVGFLRAIRAAVDEGTPLFIETPDVEWTLRHAAFFDFHYEHCSLFDRGSLALGLDRAGFEVERVESVFEGQYLLASATAGQFRGERSSGREAGDLGYRAARDASLAALAARVAARAAGGGRVALWGGASKGVTLSLLLGEAGAPVDCAIDINPRKHGMFMPVSALPIVSPAQARAREVSTALVTNPAYLTEVADLCAREALGFELIAVGPEALHAG
jgi:hypothetical protein